MTDSTRELLTVTFWIIVLGAIMALMGAPARGGSLLRGFAWVSTFFVAAFVCTFATGTLFHWLGRKRSGNWGLVGMILGLLVVAPAALLMIKILKASVS